MEVVKVQQVGNLKITLLADGTRIQENTIKGDKLEIFPNGGSLRTHPDGTKFEVLPDGTTRWLNKNGTEDDEEELSLQNHEPNVMEQPHQQENPVSVKQNFVEVQDDYSFKKTTASTVTEQAHENISNDSNQSNVQSKRLEEYLNQPNLSTIPPPPTNVSHLQSSKLQQSSNAETEEQLMYQLRTLELERLLAYTQKKQLNQTRIKDKEIEDLRNKVNKAKEAEDMARIDLQRALAKAEASHKAAIASLKSENERLKNTLDNKPTSLLSGLLGTGQPSSKVQAKINANQNEREIARYIEQLKAECEKEKQRGDKYKVEAQQYLELATSEQFKVGELNEEIAKLKAFMGKMEAKIRALKTDRQGWQQQKEDLILKAGWAAEQLQIVQQELEREREIRILPSRMAVVRQAEEVARLTEENRVLKENGGVIPVDKIASIKNAKPKPVKEVVTETENFESYVPETVTTPAGALGSQTISELVAMKAKQREQRQIKMDDIIKKNKLEKQKVQNVGGINEAFQKVITSRRTDMTLSDSDDDGFD